MTALVKIPPIEECTPEEFALGLADPMWRLSNLYWITAKGDDRDDNDPDKAPDVVIKFKPNRFQRRLMKRLHWRNIILKARQLGFTTFIAILFLDCCLFRSNVRAGIIAQDLDAVEAIFQTKVKFAYDHLPDAMKAEMPLATESKRELKFAHNGSVIRVGTSMRSGTYQYLHISEFGKICAKAPEKAKEVVTGSLPAAEKGMIFIESTAEGREGEFYDMCQRAMALVEQGRKPNRAQYAFHFFPWWGAMEYRMDPDNVVITAKDHEYFDQIEAKAGTTIDLEQRAWWVSTRDEAFSGQPEKMWQEFPSTPEEAFQQSTEGCYYAVQMAAARKGKRITTVPYTPGVPVNTFWDIGNSDGTAIWFHQRVGLQDRFIKFLEGWGEPYSHFVQLMQATGWVWGRHFLPHDGNYVRQGQDVDSQKTPREMLEALGLRHIEIVPRVLELQHGISTTRDAFASAWFDEEGCKEGLIHLERYRKKWNASTGCFTDQPLKDIHTEGADAFRQWAQSRGELDQRVTAGQRPNRKNRSGRVV